MIRKYSITVTSDEAADDLLGSLITLEDICTYAHNEPLLHKVLIEDDSTACPNVDVYIYDANPSSTTAADNAEFAIHANDLQKVIGVASITTFYHGAIHSIGQSDGLAIPIYAADQGNDIYAHVVLRGTPPNGWSGTAKYITFEFIN